jgi:mono/diheme cytochrome c family protein
MGAGGETRVFLGKAELFCAAHGLEVAVKMWRGPIPVGRLALLVALVALALGSLAGCSDESAQTENSAYARGHTLYLKVCIACHHADPGQEGNLGPAIANASLELLRAKVLRGEYPEGHTPRRDTKQMPQFQYLESTLPDLAAFLAGPEDR